ncbi:MAG: hypothetical protein AB1756_10400 [Acidobacteriota bacterium]
MLKIDGATWAEIAAIIFGAASILAIYFLSRHLKGEKSNWKNSWGAPAALAVQLPFICYSFSGMETAPFTFLIVASAIIFLRALEQDRPRLLSWSSVILSLAYLTRPETPILFLFNIVFLVIYGVFWKKRAMIPVYLCRHAILFIAMAIIFSLWRYLYYGDFLPNTYYAKIGSYSSALLLRGLDYIWNFSQLSFLILIIPLVLILKLREMKYQILYITGVVLFLSLAVAVEGGDHLALYRFAVPILPFLCLFYQEFSSGVVQSLFRSSLWSNLKPYLIVFLSLLISISSSGLYFVKASKHEMTEYQRARFEVDLAQRWSEFGKWLHQHYNPDRTVALSTIGAISFYSGLKAIDMVGLTDRHIAHRPIHTGGGYIGHEKYDNYYILRRAPDIIIVHHIVDWDFPITEGEYQKMLYFGAQQELVEMPEFKNNYCFKTFPAGDKKFYAFYLRCSSVSAP